MVQLVVKADNLFLPTYFYFTDFEACQLRLRIAGYFVLNWLFCRFSLNCVCYLLFDIYIYLMILAAPSPLAVMMFSLSDIYILFLLTYSSPCVSTCIFTYPSGRLLDPVSRAISAIGRI